MGSRGASSGTGSISNSLYSKWHDASLIAEKGRALAFRNPQENWFKMTDAIGEFEKVDRVLAKKANSSYGRNLFNYNEVTNGAGTRLKDDTYVSIKGSDGGPNHGLVVVERTGSYGMKGEYKTFPNYEDAYRFARNIVKKYGKE